MKLLAQFPLFLLVFVAYNLVLSAQWGASQKGLAKEEAAEQAPAAAAPVAEPAAPEETPPPAPSDAAPAAGSSPAPGPAAAPADSAPPPKPAFVHPFNRPFLTVPLPSGAQCPATVNDLFLIIAVVFLYFELFKATRAGTPTIMEHVFSLIVFLAFLLEFVLFKGAGTSTFLVLTLMSFLDVIAGFTITIATARRDFGGAGAARVA